MTKLEAMLKYVSEHNDFYKKRIKDYGITNPLVQGHFVLIIWFRFGIMIWQDFRITIGI